MDKFTKKEIDEAIVRIRELARDLAKKAEMQAARIRHGFQCPECHGVQVAARTSRFWAQPEGWQCEDCGCQFSPPINLSK